MKKFESRSVPSQRGGEISENMKPSFSSTLLDAIYRSIDDDDDDTASKRHHREAREPCFPCSNMNKKQINTPSLSRKNKHLQGTSSSSSCSSYGGFSSSDTEPAFRSNRTAPPPPLKTKNKPGSIASRIRDLRRAKPPVSPGARVASFINSLFASTRKAKPAEEEQPCSTGSSYSRSCLSKNASMKEKRSVRFDPVIVKENWLPPSGGKRVHGGGVVAPPGRGRKMKDRVEEMMRRMKDDENEDGESDSSSDLFELENLKASIEEGGYRDELPVFETTHLRVKRAPCLRF